MIVKAKASYSRISPKKVRQIVDLIRGKDVPSSQAILANVNKGGCDVVEKVLNTAVANAKQKGLMEDQLYVSKVTANEGPMWKRYRAGAFGRAMPILKRTTHLICH